MKVILLEKIGKTGNIGDKVTVKPGFSRNFLIPQGKALSATPANIAEFEKRRTGLEAAANEKKATALARAEKLAELSVTISVNTNDEGKLFGSIGAHEIAKAITTAGEEVAKSEVRLPNGALHESGDHNIDIHLHTEIKQTVILTILPLQSN